MKHLQLSLILVLLTLGMFAQNVAITDDDNYSAEASAMLDVKSTNKGMLVPRLTTLQRLTIASPATGLLVFDTDSSAFYFYDGLAWTDLSSSESEYWNANESGIYMAKSNLNLGIGAASADGKLEVQGDGTGGAGELLFAVKNANGDTVFAVYDGGVRVYVDDTPTKAAGSRGGFAVGGFSSGKGTIGNEYLRITPDSVRIYVDDDSQGKGAGSRGGFAVGGFSSGKISSSEFLRVTGDSVRVYVKDPAKAAGSRGGFAVGGFSSGKSGETDYLQISKDNYFIGLGAGANNSTGTYNSFMGYQTGFFNETGYRNIFLGYQAGYNNLGGTSTEGSYNIFLGNLSGYSNTTGHNNLFMGYQSGKNNTTGNYNLFLGYNAGVSNTTGKENTYIGYNAGSLDTTGFHNIYIGYYAGANAHAGAIYQNYRNVVIGSFAGYNMEGSSSSTFVGYGAGRYTTTGIANTFFGSEAGEDNTTAGNNTNIGYKAGKSNTTGSYNTFLGGYSGYNVDGGYRNTFLGQKAGYAYTSGGTNVFIGADAAYNKTSGSGNIHIGYQSGYNDTGGTGDNNVAIGYQSGYTGSGDRNVFLGYKAGYSESGSDKLYIDNSDTSSPLIYGDFSTNELEINGALSTSGNLTVGGTFTAENGIDLTGSLVLSSDLTVGGTGTFDTTLNVTSDFTAGGTGTFTGLLSANGGLSVTGTANISSTFTANSTAYLNGTTYLNENTIFNGTSFRIANSPGSGTTPTNYVYQGSTGSTSKSYAFAIYDALWVTDNAFFDEDLTVTGATNLSDNVILGGTYMKLTTAPGSGTNPTNYFYQGSRGSASKSDAFAIYDALWVTDNVYLPESYDTKITASDRRKMYIGPAGLVGYNTSKADELKNVADMEEIDWLFKLHPVNFEYKAEPNASKEYGLVADEVAKVNKLFVGFDKNGNPETVNYDQLIAPLLKAVQDQQKLIKELQQRIEILENNNQ